jgi:hypothetical protein
MGGVDPQERLSGTEAQRWFLAGFIEGEGSLCVAVKQLATARFGFVLDPEFSLYQHETGRALLELARQVFGAGRIRPKPGAPHVLVFSIETRCGLRQRVIPFLM